jgi:uncharacterized membrane protein
MKNKFLASIKPLLKSVFVIVLAIALVFGQADSAWAASRGGRMGGGSFRMPSSRSYGAPTRTYQPPVGGGGYYGGGGFGFPFIIPFFGFGGGFGGLFTILIFFAVANFLVSTVRRIQSGDSLDGTPASPTVTVSQLQLGLLADAKTLQADLDRIAQAADTGSSAGLAQVLQETTLSLLRHPEYWVYAKANTQQVALESAELSFNRLAITERSKFSAETLSNVNNLLKQGDRPKELNSTGELAQPTLADQQPGEYIVVTLITASEGKQPLPTVNDSGDVRRALSQLGAIPAEKLLALEVLWTPQAEADTLSSDDMLTQYPDLKMI